MLYNNKTKLIFYSKISQLAMDRGGSGFGKSDVARTADVLILVQRPTVASPKCFLAAMPLSCHPDLRKERSIKPRSFLYR